jgi:PleD family two-component response regulator
MTLPTPQPKPLRRAPLLHLIATVLQTDFALESPARTLLPPATPKTPTMTGHGLAHRGSVASSQLHLRSSDGSAVSPDLSTSKREDALNSSAERCVLVAEDNDTNRVVVSQLLKRGRCSVIEATNGVEAVDMLSNSVDVVLMDVHMPVMDGIDAAYVALLPCCRLTR